MQIIGCFLIIFLNGQQQEVLATGNVLSTKGDWITVDFSNSLSTYSEDEKWKNYQVNKQDCILKTLKKKRYENQTSSDK